MSEKSLAGRKALVTGGARGIGAAIAEALAHAGASVMIGDILVDLGKETAGRLAKTGARTGCVELNVTDDAQWEKAVAATIAALGGYDILINNAGIEITSLVIDLKAEDLRRMCDVNIVGTGLGMKHAFRAMRPGGSAGAGGAIVNVASVNGVVPGMQQGIYSITKAAVISMTKAFAVECAESGVRCNALLPGLTDTKFASVLVNTPAILKSALAHVPMRRVAQPSEMAGAALYLASDAASYTTGAVLNVDGGYLSV